MKKIIFTSLVGAFAVSSLFAQVKILNEGLSPSGVSNEGIVAGSYGQAAPYFLWNPETGTKKEIGGISAGNGYGGNAKFSADGKYLSGTMVSEIVISTDWKKTTLLERDYTITDMCYPTASMDMGFAVAKSPTDNTKGAFLKTTDGGLSWYDVADKVNVGLEAVCFLNDKVGLIGGRNAYFAYTTAQGREWNPMTPRPADNEDNVVAYRTIDFIHEEPYFGVVGAELADGKFAVYQSPDGAETWQVATGVKGIPNHITHVGGVFFMGTQDGRIQKSVDNGLTWTEVFKTGGFLQYGGPIFKIRFVDDKTGIALSDLGLVYRTTNGGTSWAFVAVDPEVTNKVIWNDVIWMDSKNVTVVGTKGTVYSSADAGLTWTSQSIETDGVTDLHMICKSEKVLNIGGIHGNVYRKSLIDKKMAGGMGRYDVEAEKWTPLGHFDCIKDVSTGSGYAISGDGKTVVGLAYRNNPAEIVNNGTYATAVAWTEGKGLVELGSLYSNIDRATRANAVSHDGSVVVGWQDRNGPWHSAVWRKEAAGGYAKNEYLLIDPNGAANESNYITQCSSVSPNGKWIGGYGRSIASGPLSILDDDQRIANQPWIWSQETGVKRLGVIEELIGMDGAVGNVSAVSDDGTVVGFWVIDKSMYPFIWTEEGGMQNLNTYITDNYDYDLGDNVLCSVVSMSPNGRYIVGWGLDMEAQSTIAFTLDLEAPTNIVDTPESKSCNVKVYPNPVSDVLHIDLNADASAKIRLTNMQGCTVLQDEINSSADISLNNLVEGLYMLETTVNGVRKIHKIEVLH